jgi:ATP-dependent DNA helicase RecG
VTNDEKRHELRPCTRATIDDLSRVSFERDFHDGKLQDDDAFEQLARVRGMLCEGSRTPTILGVLALAPSVRVFLPGAYVQFLQIDGTSLDAKILDHAVIEGPLFRLFENLDRRLQPYVSEATTVFRGEDLRELVANAVMHRTYVGTHAPIAIHGFRDRLDVVSPGGPVGNVTAATFGRPGVTEFRNPRLVDAMKQAGLARGDGHGIERVNQRRIAEGKSPIRWRIDESHVVATLAIN